jgi:hypothetical protein
LLPPGSASLGDYVRSDRPRFCVYSTRTDLERVVEGEQRYWVHVAIDRFTAQVIDKRIEVVNE